MKTFIFLAASAVAFVPRSASAQQRVPVVTLPPASARASEALGPVLGVRQLPDGRVLVNDGGRRQLRVFDATLARSTVLLDSALSGANSYGPRRTPLIAYVGDSSLFADIVSQTILVLDPNGRVARAMSLPTTSDLIAFTGSASSGVDPMGRLVYRGAFAARPGGPQPSAQSDSLPILRADLESRRVDTVARVSQPSATRMSMVRSDDGKTSMKVVINPLQTIDEWALLPDGTVAIVRGHDYHVDWISADGTVRSTAKMPFDWRRLTDDEKQKLVDSTRAATDAAEAKNAAIAKGGAPNAPDHTAAASAEVAAMALMHVRGDAGAPQPINMNAKPTVEYASLKDIADYYPPMRIGATKADLDGNLWILPTTSAQSTAGELVYDVVNQKGDVFERVRLAQGRTIAGFAKGGVVYLTYYDAAKGYFLERTKLAGATKTAQ